MMELMAMVLVEVMVMGLWRVLVGMQVDGR
jgi:hypothetical protein